MIRSSRTEQHQLIRTARAPWLEVFFLAFGILLIAPSISAQTTVAASPRQVDNDQQVANIERRISTLTEALSQTQAALQQSQHELMQLREEMDAIRARNSLASAGLDSHQPASQTSNRGSATKESSSQAGNSSMQSEIRSLQDQQEMLQAEIKQHEQTKVESASKYNLAVTGLALFNAFSNAGVVDNAELPTYALPRNPGSSHGSVGGSLRQTMLGVIATGPILAGAQSFASVNVDFFGGSSTNSFGYSTLDGFVRLRDAQLGLIWDSRRLQVGYNSPLISPLSPSSITTVAQPALSGSGNLWSWSPQIQFEQDVNIRGAHRMSFEAGLISPQSPNYSSIQLDSPIQASRRPGVEGRIAYHADRSSSGLSSSGLSRSLVVGVGVYKANQFYNSTTTIHAWAVTGDWQIPLSKWFDLSGEVYRGRALGGLGGGLYKDIYVGTDPITSLPRTTGIDTAGGWAQLKLTLSSHWEANSMFGMDDAFSSSFRSVVLPANTSPFTLTARNNTFTGNIIFRPRSSIILSPEYRRLETWRYTGAAYVANIFALSAGYKF